MTAEPPTIAAILTPLSPGAIGVIAISGPQALAICNRALRKLRTDGPPVFQLNRPARCRIFDADTVLDDALAIRIALDHVELHCHGGTRLMERVLESLVRLGAESRSADDFVRATTNQPTTLTDIDAALTRATSRRVAMWLLAQRSILPGFLDKFASLNDEQKTAYRTRTQLAIRLLRGLRIAIIGPPNAGKSTLANCLIGGDRIITSSIPGTTRDWISETALIKGWPITLTDTAGVRDATCEIETEAIRRGQAQAQSADLVLIVLDASQPAVTQIEIYKNLTKTIDRSRRIIVQNKLDMPTATSIDLPNERITKISARTREGLQGLELAIEQSLGLTQLLDDEPTGFAQSHHIG